MSGHWDLQFWMVLNHYQCASRGNMLVFDIAGQIICMILASCFALLADCCLHIVLLFVLEMLSLPGLP